MRALTAAVVVMGVLIAAGLAVVVGTIAQRLARAPAEAGPGFGTRDLAPAAGETLVGVTASGDRLVLHLAGPGGNARVEIVDLRDGRTLGSILVRPRP